MYLSDRWSTRWGRSAAPRVQLCPDARAAPRHFLRGVVSSRVPTDRSSSGPGALNDAGHSGSDVVRPPEDVVRFYSRVGRLFEAWGRLVDSRARVRVRALCAVTDTDAVLEVGVGAGSQLAALASANRSGRTVGVDLADGMLRETRRRLTAASMTHVELLRADACELPFADDEFDVVTSAYVLDILPWDDIRRALTEFRRVLRPGGRLVLCHVTPGERGWHRVGDHLYGSGLPLTGNCRGLRLTALLTDGGFEAITREYSVQLLLPSEILAARVPRHGDAPDRVSATVE
jgi:ubiquinone/menaquinone biosynthesis C-methylase UbiE